MDSADVHIQSHEDAAWYPLRAFRLKLSSGNSFPEHVERFNQTAGTRIVPFAPTYIQVGKGGGAVRRSVRPLACNYVFVRGSEAEVRDFIKLYPVYSPLYNKTDLTRVMTSVGDAEMKNFIRLTEAYNNDLHCYAPSEVDLRKGDLVRIIGGQFEGVEGILMTQKGKDGGRVVINVSDILAAETLEISPKYIRVMQFAPASKRLYDVLDAMIPRLQRAKKEMENEGSLSQHSRSALNYFVDRYGYTKIDEAKIRAKHHLLLLSALAMLDGGKSVPSGSRHAALRQSVEDNVDSLLKDVTNPKTLSRIMPLLPQGITAADEKLNE